jgi:hypothetical protein
MDERILQIEGWMEEVELRWLYEVASKVPAGELLVEIGAWQGRSSAAIFTGARGKSRAVTIDTWQGSPDEPHEIAKTVDMCAMFLRNMRDLGILIEPFQSYKGLRNGNYYLTGDSLSVVDDFPDESICWMFYDGRHTMTGENLDAWMPKMKPDAILSGHDYFCFYDYIQQEIHKRFYIHQIIHSIWVRYLGLEPPSWY